MPQGSPSRGANQPSGAEKEAERALTDRGETPADAPSTPGAEAPTNGEPSPEAGEAAVQGDRMLGEFRLLRRLGKGGMAEVFLAEQTSLRRNVAVKVLYEDRLSDQSHLKRFKTEAMAAAALSHPNIVQVYMIGEQEGTHYIAQEYVQGMNLREFLGRKGTPELNVALHVMKQVASALQAAHTAGIIHRDIKPENIMITRRGDVKVADFGLAQLTLGGERLNLTQEGITMGTPLYMSPEQVNGKKLDPRSDLYSLGVTCYHMLTGAPPFRGQTALSVAVQHLKQEPERLEKVRGDLPPVVCRIVHKMMAKNPEKRYQSAQEILRDLKRVTDKAVDPGEAPHEAEENVAEIEPTVSKPGSRWLRVARRLWMFPDKPVAVQIWTVTLLTLLVGGAAAGAGWFLREPDPFAAPVRGAAAVPTQDSVAKQYQYAARLKSDEAAWQAVIDFRPAAAADKLFQDYARQQLAMLYLSRRRLDEADALFAEFASYGSSQPQWRALGLAGQAVILNLRQEYQESQKVINDLKPLYPRLDGRMRSLVSETVKRNVAALDRELDQDWQALFDAPEAESGAPRE